MLYHSKFGISLLALVACRIPPVIYCFMTFLLTASNSFCASRHSTVILQSKQWHKISLINQQQQGHRSQRRLSAVSRNRGRMKLAIPEVWGGLIIAAPNDAKWDNLGRIRNEKAMFCLCVFLVEWLMIGAFFLLGSWFGYRNYDSSGPSGHLVWTLCGGFRHLWKGPLKREMLWIFFARQRGDASTM